MSTAALRPDACTVFRTSERFPLECGRSLSHLELAYETWGTLDPAGSNAVLVCHALTGSSHAAASRPGDQGWWGALIGPGRAIDPAHDLIICANLLGSCYGSSGPTSASPSFPAVTTGDMVRAQRELLRHLGVDRLRLVIGGSLGGMVTWQWLVEYPEMVRAAIPIAATAQASAWQIALNQVARQAILNDPAWHGGRYRDAGPATGLALARMIAMISYRSERELQQRFGRRRQEGAGGLYAVEGYLSHHGDKLARRFDARAYVTLTRAMDSHDVARGHRDLASALGRVEAEVLAVGIDSDVLFPPASIRDTVASLRRMGKRARYAEITSPCGHDAFLIELVQLDRIVGELTPRRLSCVC